MAERIIQTETLEGIADSIRSKTGKSEAIPVPNMASEIKGIVSDETSKYLEERYEEVILPNIKKVKANAFYIDITMKSLSIPNVTRIDSRAFYDCRNLVSVSMPNVTSIALEAFYLCNSIVSIVLPSSLVSTGHYAFGNCSGLKTVTFKGIPTSLNVLTFADSTNLTTINVPWSEGEVENAPWGATNATINYNYTGE
jgi:hypothetical protein